MTLGTMMRRGLLAVLLATPGAAWSQTVYSYVDAQGVRVYTNIPPAMAPPQPIPILPKSQADDSDPTPGKATTSRPVMAGRSSSAPATSHTKFTSAPELRANLESLIESYSALNGLDPALVRSVIATESGFNPGAISKKGAQGLMQLMPGTAARLGVSNSFDAEENIRGGTKHLRALLDAFDNDLILSLAAYNAGENLVQKTRRVPNFPETHAYVRQVTQRYGRRDVPQPKGQELAEKQANTCYRYVDASGVLYLTNIPPLRWREANQLLWQPTAQSPQ